MLENNEGFGWIADTSGLTAANVANCPLLVVIFDYGKRLDVIFHHHLFVHRWRSQVHLFRS